MESRLVFADWLEEQGRTSQAQFIRCQIDATASSLSPAQRESHLAEAASLLTRFRRSWNIPLHQYLNPLGIKVRSRRGVVRRWRYHRGFVEEVSVRIPALLKHWNAISQIGPIRAISIGYGEDLNELRDWKCPEGIECVVLNVGDFAEYPLPCMNFDFLHQINTLVIQNVFLRNSGVGNSVTKGMMSLDSLVLQNCGMGLSLMTALKFGLGRKLRAVEKFDVLEHLSAIDRERETSADRDSDWWSWLRKITSR